MLLFILIVSTTVSSAAASDSCSSVSSACFSTTVSMMTFLSRDLRNLEKQYQRMEKSVKIMEKKAGKTSSFSSCADELITVGGGDETNLRCHDQEDSNRTRHLITLTQSLRHCPDDVSEACTVSETRRFDDHCLQLISKTKLDLEQCLSASACKACQCWQEKSYAKHIVKRCRTKSLPSKVAHSLKHCKSVFR